MFGSSTDQGGDVHDVLTGAASCFNAWVSTLISLEWSAWKGNWPWACIFIEWFWLIANAFHFYFCCVVRLAISLPNNWDRCFKLFASPPLSPEYGMQLVVEVFKEGQLNDFCWLLTIFIFCFCCVVRLAKFWPHNCDGGCKFLYPFLFSQRRGCNWFW